MPVAEYAANIQSGTLVFLEGEVTYREYERRLESETASVKVQWTVIEIVIESISILDGKGREGKRPRKLPAQSSRPCEQGPCILSIVSAAIT